jgi:diguanylate cyclase (GGDEF)-like protein/PAS domain S-box-containing protein
VGDVDSSEVATTERLAEIVRLAPIGLGIVDREGCTILSNEALSGMLGYTAREFTELPFQTYTHPDDIDRNDRLFAEMFAGVRDHFEMDKRFFHRDGHVVWGRLQVSVLREGAGDRMFAIGMLQDITEQKRLQDDLHRLAFEDPLTGLANRRLFQDRIEQQLKRGARRDGPLGAVLFADVDDFKTLNDTLGHQAGDDVLAALGGRVQRCLRPGDTAARLGGDEFAVLLEDVRDMDHALAVARRLKEAIEEPLTVADRVLRPAASIGVALLAADHNADRVLRDADLAMYQAKSMGSGEIAPFTPELLEAALRRLEEGSLGHKTPSTGAERDNG